MMNVRQCYSRAKKAMEGYWCRVLLIGFIYMIILLVCQMFSIILSWLMIYWSTPSWALVSLMIVRKKPLKVGDFFECFTSCKRFSQYVVCTFLNSLFITLWSLLIVMGVVKYYSYSMSYFMIAQNVDQDAYEALDKSEKIMAGKKCNLFCITFFLVLFYIPLIALLILTSLELDYYRSIDKGLLLALLDFLYYVFLTIIWHPFYHVCLAVFYESIRPNDEEIANFQPNQQIGEQSIVIGQVVNEPPIN